MKQTGNGGRFEKFRANLILRHQAVIMLRHDFKVGKGNKTD